MSRLTRDGTAEPVSRHQILRHARGQGNVHFPVQLTTSRIGNLTRLIHTLLYVMAIHTYIHTSRAKLPSITRQAAANYDALVEWALASIVAGDGAAAAGLPTPE